MSGCPPPAHHQLHCGPPIACAADALAAFDHGLSNPARPEVLLIARDVDQQMLMMLVVTDTTEADHVVDVLLNFLQASWGTSVDSVVLASMRPTTPLSNDDALIWWTLQDIAEDHDIAVIEWFILTEEYFSGAEPSSPRTLTGEEAAW